LLAEGWVVLTGGIAGNILTLSPALTLSEHHVPPFVAALRRASEAD
jgi:4-aminobutyrate aminotransferase-like enzyme